jgi:hypothetical protein
VQVLCSLIVAMADCPRGSPFAGARGTDLWGTDARAPALT